MKTFRTTISEPVKQEPPPLTAAEARFLSERGIDPETPVVNIQVRAWKPDEIAMIRLISGKRGIKLNFYN